MTTHRKVTELTSAQVRRWLTEAGIDLARELTIEDRLVTSCRVDFGYSGPWRTANEVTIQGPKYIRRQAWNLLFFETGLAVAPYPDRDEWSIPDREEVQS